MLGPIDDLRKVDLGRMDEGGLSKKHFIRMASILKDAIHSADDDRDRQKMIRVAEELASFCAEMNPRFDRARFLAACEVDYEPTEQEPEKHPRYNVDIPNRGHYKDDEE